MENKKFKKGQQVFWNNEPCKFVTYLSDEEEVAVVEISLDVHDYDEDEIYPVQRSVIVPVRSIYAEKISTEAQKELSRYEQQELERKQKERHDLIMEVAELREAKRKMLSENFEKGAYIALFQFLSGKEVYAVGEWQEGIVNLSKEDFSGEVIITFSHADGSPGTVEIKKKVGYDHFKRYRIGVNEGQLHFTLQRKLMNNFSFNCSSKSLEQRKAIAKKYNIPLPDVDAYISDAIKRENKIKLDRIAKAKAELKALEEK